ncbi:MAG: DinB family protein [Thermomicrobiales bacterium]|nr:DinB family protein [Thermomicrobiales bacterium]
MNETTVAGGSAEHEALVDQLRAFPAEVARAIEGVPEEALKRPGSDGGWGVAEVLGHLRDWEEVFRDRIRAIRSEDRPALPAYDDALWEIEHDYGAQTPQSALNSFEAVRSETVGLLADLTPQEWEQVGIHSSHGPITIRWIAEYLRGHDADHLRQIREALG